MLFPVTARFALRVLSFMSLAAVAAAQSSLVFTPPSGVAAKNKHVVLLSGDEEYRSEESLPMLAKVLSQRHGFKTTVLFALDPDGTINPNNQASLSGDEALDGAAQTPPDDNPLVPAPGKASYTTFSAERSTFTGRRTALRRPSRSWGSSR